MLGRLHIAFDPQTFSLQAYGGVSRYVAELARCLRALPQTRVSVLAFAHINGYLQPGEGVVGRRMPEIPEPLRRPLARANQAAARRWLARHGADLVHETYYSHARTAPPGMPTVLTVHDMIHEKFPDYAPRTQRIAAAKRAALARADHVICVSESTRRDLLEITGIDPAHVSVVRHGVSIPAGDAPRPVAGPYVLFVGKRGGYKGFDTLLEAYAGPVQREYRLVCFGDAPFSRDELRRMDALGVQRERVCHAFGDDAALAAHYRHAALFAYPSRYEGFGMPPLEAMALGCPVVCSDAASLPEVAGEAARMFTAGDAQALRAAMEAVLDSPGVAADLCERGRRRAAMFTWEACARATQEAYARLLQTR